MLVVLTLSGVTAGATASDGIGNPVGIVAAGQGSWHFPTYLNTPVPTAVFTLTEYILRVLTCEAYTGVQSQLVNGYSVVSVPIVKTTGAVIVVVSGIGCAITTQYF